MFRKLINGWAKRQTLVTLVFLVFVIAYPILFKSYYLRNIAIQCLLYSMLSLALNFIMGYTGIVVLGMAAFYGIGAYTLALLTTRLGLTFIPATLLAMLAAFIAGVLIGLPTLRIQGNYLAIVTLGFCEIVRIIELNWVSLTNGPFGIKQIPAPSIFGVTDIFGLKLSKPIGKYYLAVVLLILVVLFMHNMINSRSGRAWKAIKGDPVAAQAMAVQASTLAAQAAQKEAEKLAERIERKHAAGGMQAGLAAAGDSMSELEEALRVVRMDVEGDL